MNTDAPLYVDVTEGKSSDTKIFRITGPITLVNLFGLQGELRKGGVPKVSVLDLSGVPYMDSAGLGVLLGQFAHAQRHGNKFGLVGITPRVLTIFEITHTDQILPIFATQADAENSF